MTITRERTPASQQACTTNDRDEPMWNESHTFYPILHSLCTHTHEHTRNVGREFVWKCYILHIHSTYLWFMGKQQATIKFHEQKENKISHKNRCACVSRARSHSHLTIYLRACVCVRVFVYTLLIFQCMRWWRYTSSVFLLFFLLFTSVLCFSQANTGLHC